MEEPTIIDYVFSQFGGAAAIISACFAFLAGIMSKRILQKEVKSLEKKLNEDRSKYEMKMKQYTICVNPVTSILGKLLYKTARAEDLANYEADRMEAIALLGFFSSKYAVESYMRIIETINGSIEKENSLYFISKNNFNKTARHAIEFISIARKDIGITDDENTILYEFESNAAP
ncbi:hypothetical protein WKI13_17625 [Teredinibacter turnerae]|uniref:hypothetical protein n=1 Tax=Teredinibacter turnerae TaxID=2426 RepID=UPI0003700494|nr:hypothetical protein [Teredinibacter turnerae]